MSIWTFQQSYFQKWKRIEIKQENILQFFSKTQKKKKKMKKNLNNNNNKRNNNNNNKRKNNNDEGYWVSNQKNLEK